jgi:FkbM family methyltransferase
MSPTLVLYKKLLHSPTPLAKWGANTLEKRIGKKLYEMPYLTGQVWASPVQNIGRHILLSGSYEPTIVSMVQNFAHDGFSMVDVGANIGLHTLASVFAAKPNNSQTWVAFEPEPTTFGRLQANCQLNGVHKVQLQQVGIGREAGTLTIHSSTDANEGSHSLLTRPDTAPSGTVPITTLDHIMPPLVPAHEPVLVKIDVEGFEPAVLEGGLAWLTGLEEAAVIMEISPTLLRNDGRSETDLLDLLHQCGFTNHIIIHDSDTFVPDGSLINDYFNILAWKGERAGRVYEQLPFFYTLHHPPANAPTFVDWARFSTIPPLTERQQKMAQLQKEAALAVWTFGNAHPLIGRMRQVWYNIAARWGDQRLAEQQTHLNHQLLQLLRQQEAQLNAQAREIAALRDLARSSKENTHD